MNNNFFKILRPGINTTYQDDGRFHMQHFGVVPSGCMDHKSFLIANALIGNDVVISKARGKWIQKEIGMVKPWIIASFHPAFLMRQPEQKKLSWIDLKMVREKMKKLKNLIKRL